MSDDITPGQLRAARALIGITREDLAAIAKTTERTLARTEAGETKPRPSTRATIRAALENLGVIFVDPNGEGPGVRLRKEV